MSTGIVLNSSVSIAIDKGGFGNETTTGGGCRREL